MPTIVGAVAAATGDAPAAAGAQGLQGIDGVSQWEAIANPASWQARSHAKVAAVAARATNQSSAIHASYARYLSDPRAEIVLSMGGGPSNPRNAATVALSLSRAEQGRNVNAFPFDTESQSFFINLVLG